MTSSRTSEPQRKVFCRERHDVQPRQG